MTSYRLKTLIFCAMLVMFAVPAQVYASAMAARSGPDEEVFKAWMYLWEQSTSKFSEIMTAEDWKAAAKGRYLTSFGKVEFSKKYDIPEFENERARVADYSGDEPEYLISAKKEFSSDEACLAYYHALLEGFSALLAGDGIDISEHDDHVFFKDREDAFYRRIYVKRYLKADRGNQPRVRVSVRVEFPK
ncbi:hypothetical protein KQI65_02435 [bacterium]|nr:hypothetical protein [bacterium]